MRKLFLSLLFLPFFSYGAEVDPTVANLCENIDKIGTLAQIYEPTMMTVISPVPPYTGLVMGVISKTSVIVDFCNFVNDMQTQDTTSKVFRTKQFTNDLTGRKWDSHFQQAEDTFNFSQSVYDFENNESRKGYLESEQGNRELNDFVKTTQVYVDKNFNGNDADKEAAQINQQEINSFSKLITKRAVINEATTCPSLEDKPNYRKIYEKEIQPQEKILEKAENDIEFYEQKLNELGPKFLEFSEQDIYFANLDKLKRAGVGLDVAITKKNEESVKAGKTLDSNGVPKKKRIAIAREVQTYTVKSEDTLFSNFIEKYSPVWQKWIKLTYLTNTKTYGLFYAQEKIESELRDFSYECRESDVMAGYENYPNYETLLDKRMKNCKENLTIDEKNSENLLDFYIKKYKEALYRKYSSVSKIWTAESLYFGRNRFVSANGKNSAATTYQAENIQCSDTLSAIEMKKLNLEQSSTNAELRESILKNKMKQNIMKQDSINQHKKIMKEVSQRNEYVENQSTSTRKSLKKEGTLMIPIRGGGSNGK